MYEDISHHYSMYNPKYVETVRCDRCDSPDGTPLFEFNYHLYCEDCFRLMSHEQEFRKKYGLNDEVRE